MTEATTHFKPCEICGSEHWTISWRGRVRDGAFGRLSNATAVGRCEDCGVERLAEASCKNDDFYHTEEYRRLLDEPTDAAGFFALHDAMQIERLNVIGPQNLRGKIVADIGCAAGSFLDHVRGLASEAIAVEPATGYHGTLAARGCKVYSDTLSAARAHAKQVDYAFTFSVIEHVPDPRAFLAEIALLLAPNGRMVLSTPNRRDILMALLPDVYPSFFYRTVHRWYFDADSLARCAAEAGLAVAESRCIHRFGLSNALLWLRDRRPGGRQALPGLADPLLDRVWQWRLEEAGVGDYLYVTLQREK